jgi:hypothetical protein
MIHEPTIETHDGKQTLVTAGFVTCEKCGAVTVSFFGLSPEALELFRRCEKCRLPEFSATPVACPCGRELTVAFDRVLSEEEKDLVYKAFARGQCLDCAGVKL